MKKKFRSFKDARKYAQKLKLNGYDDWIEFRKSGKRPTDIPSNPAQFYKHEWISWGDWLGTGKIATSKMKFLSHNETKKIIKKFKINNQKEYRTLAKTGKLPKEIPRDPQHIYKNKGWKGWGEFLGTGVISNQKRTFLSYERAKKEVRKLGINTLRKWQKAVSEGKIPKNLPTLPPRTYKKEWLDWGEFLGTGNKAPRDINYLPFSQAKELYQKIVQENNIKSMSQWEEYVRTHKLPQNLPRQPQYTYSKKNIVKKKQMSNKK